MTARRNGGKVAEQIGPFPDGELQRAVELGAIDDRSVRVWVRQPGTSTLRAELVVEGRDPVAATIELSAEHDWTGVAQISLPEPAPSKPFTVSAAGIRRSGRLAPSNAMR